MRRLANWLLRRTGLYLLLVLAVAFGPLVVHAIVSPGVRDELMSPREVTRRFERLRETASEDFTRTRAGIAALPASAVDQRMRAAQAERAEVRRRLSARDGWFGAIRPQAILERKRLELREAALAGEIQLLGRAQEGHAVRGQLQAAATAAGAAVTAARARCDAANAQARRFNRRPDLERSVRNALTQEAQRLTEEARRQCAAYARVRAEARRQVQGLQSRLAATRQAYADTDLRTQAAISGVALNLSGTLQSVLVTAAALLAGILVTPYLIRLAFYFGLAPLAARRPVIRLPWPGTGASPPSAQASAPSVSLTPGVGEVLLVRQGFLQSTSGSGAKATQALLDWRHPLTSLASGLVFLTRIEGGQATTVSAVGDPFAEVAILDLPPGAACVLQPRAIAAVAQPRGRSLRITSHWRLGSLHAWLTLQLRYLVFHGPARLVIQGGRGIRVESVRPGRVFGPGQLVGFSADVGYSVTRSETFWPYFLGLQPLLKDKVEAGDGVLVLEEAPMAQAAGGRARRGLEGAAEALLKLVGV